MTAGSTTMSETARLGGTNEERLRIEHKRGTREIWSLDPTKRTNLLKVAIAVLLALIYHSLIRELLKKLK